jgi:hypothetical protein
MREHSYDEKWAKDRHRSDYENCLIGSLTPEDVCQHRQWNSEANGQGCYQAGRVKTAPQPQQLWQDGPYEAVNDEVLPLPDSWQFERFTVGKMNDKESRPQKSRAEEAHKAKEHGSIHVLFVVDFSPQ